MKKNLSTLFLTMAFVLLCSIGVMADTTQPAVEQTVTVPAKYYGNEREVSMNYSYNNNSIMSSEKRGIVIPLKVSYPGTIKIKTRFTSLQKDTVIVLYSDKACSNKAGYSDYISLGDPIEKDLYIPVTTPGTYYLGIYSNYFDDSIFTNSFVLSFSQYTDIDKTIKSGQSITYYNKSSSVYYWFKYVAEQTGVVKIGTSVHGFGDVSITNAGKRTLAEYGYISETSPITCAVKKGYTYYIKIRIVPINGLDRINTISVKNTAIKEKSGKSKKKAVKIKAKKKISGVIAAGENRADWYKLKNLKKKKLSIYISGKATGKIVFTIYNSKGKKLDSREGNTGSRKLIITNGSTYGKANKGTYYIKVSRKDSKSNGSYSIKWK